MTATYDVIVLGVGGFGSGVLDHLARRGVKVLGIERFGLAHDRGSSHGQTRIIRKAYFEHPDYVPLCLAAYDLWRDLEADSGTLLMHLCGLMLAGPENGEAIAGAKTAARQHNLPIEELSASESAGRFPGFRIPDRDRVVFEADAGFLLVEDCVRAHIDRAIRFGAVVQTGETVRAWNSDGNTVVVQTDRDTYSAAKLVITPGAWASQLLPRIGVDWEVLRKPLFWHEAASPALQIENGCPAFFFEQNNRAFYGFPCLDGRLLKVAEHTGGNVVTDPAKVDRAIHAADTEAIPAFLAECLPAVATTPDSHSVCLYTLTPDRHFVVDFHPQFANVVIGAGFSGHGFKFTTVLGKTLADLALDGRTSLPVRFLSMDRFAH